MSMRRNLVATLILGWTAVALAAVDSKDLLVIPQSAQETLVQRDIPVTFKASAFFLAEWTGEQQAQMRKAGIPFEVILRNVKEDQPLFLFELHEGDEPPAAWATLFRQGPNVVAAMDDREAQAWAVQGQHPVRLWHEPHGWGRPSESLVAYDCTYKPLIADLLTRTSQAQWLDWDEKLSGLDSIVLGGATYTIATRFTSTMFSGAANAKAYDFVKQQAQAWGFSGANLEDDPYSTGPAGKNLVLTIPGQTSSEVLLTAHLDSIFQSGDSTVSAPGANDNGTGVSTVLEAARLLRQYRLQRTVRLVLFTGEEQGLYGSAAYTADHAMGSILGVLNLDMFGYDANGDRCFEVHCGTLQSSIDVGDCFVTSIGSYALGLGHDFLTTTATNRSDHASFWNVGVGAIEIAENFFNDSLPGGCVGSDANPNYHTNNDRIATNMHPPFAFSIGKTALATIAAMAVPVETCFTSAPSIVATGAPDRVDLAWAPIAGASRYRIYRATNGCGGNFVSIGEANGTSYADPLAAAGSYAYKIEAATADSCFSQESNCASASPITSPSVAYRTGSARVIADSGDHDLTPDNCELVTVQLELTNNGNQPLTGVTLAAAASSHPAVQIAGSMPLGVGTLAIGQSKPATFRFYLGENGSSAACAADIPFTVTSDSDQTAPSQQSFSLASEAEGASGVLSFPFDGDLSGWSVATGSFTSAPGGAPGSTNGSLRSQSANNVCDAIVSPVLTPGGPSTMTMWVNFSIEGSGGAPSRWDRAVVRAVNATDGTKTLLVPTGVPYNTTGTETGLCDSLGSLQGWSGDHLTWSQASFDLTSFAGTPIRIEVKFSTDGSTLGTQGTNQGFWLDQVEITNASSIRCDAMSNACAPLPAEVSPAGAPVPLTIGKSGASHDLVFSESAGAAAYHVYTGTLASLRAGVYDHAAGGLCGYTDAQPGDGIVSAMAAVPADSYLLVVGANGSGESVYGSATAGTIPMALDACP